MGGAAGDVLRLQRAAGNRATTALLAARGRPATLQRQLFTPMGPGGGYGGVMGRDRGRASGSAGGAAPALRQGAVIRQGPIGDVVLPLPDWAFLPTKSLDRSWARALDKTTLLPSIPIPSLGVRLDVRGHADARAAIHGSYSGALRNITVGMSYGQAALLGAAAAAGGTAPALAGLLAFAEFRGLADLEVLGRVALQLDVSGGLEAAATVGGLFDVASVGAGLTAGAGAEAELAFRDRVGLYYANRRLTFNERAGITVSTGLRFNLNAYVVARLLGFDWRREWNLVSRDIGHRWSFGANLDIHHDSRGPTRANVTLADDAIAVLDVARRLLELGSGAQHLTQVPTPAGGGGGAAGAPTGRTQADPIPMVWHKPPGRYPMSVQLGPQRYFLTEPDWLAVPDLPGLSDVRRNAASRPDGTRAVRIGVSTGSRYFPRIGSVWPRVASGVIRTGTKQDQFRRLLREYGFPWGSHEADHVRDLQWAGDDEYENLWPLERVYNNAANDVLNQLVTYRAADGQVRTVRLRSTPRNLYFRIASYV